MRLMILLALLLVSGSLSAQTQGAIKRVCHVSRFELAVACIKKYEGLHGPKHHPYVGYGHKLLPGERFSPKMTERQADALLRSDLRKLCAMFRGFGRDSLLLATLAYNVGCGKVMKSRMYAKMRSGNRNIYRDYVDFKRWNGKIVPSIERRRKMEYLLLFTPLYNDYFTIAKDTMQSIKYLERSANANFFWGMNAYADVLLQCGHYEETEKLCEKMAIYPYSYICTKMGDIQKDYRHDYKTAKYYYETGYKNDKDPECCDRLGDMYKDGLGVKKNLGLAITYYRLAIAYYQSLGLENDDEDRQVLNRSAKI